MGWVPRLKHLLRERAANGIGRVIAEVGAMTHAIPPDPLRWLFTGMSGREDFAAVIVLHVLPECGIARTMLAIPAFEDAALRAVGWAEGLAVCWRPPHAASR